MSGMTSERLAEIRVRAEAATQGPWESGKEEPNKYGVTEWAIFMPDAGCDMALVEREQDAEFVAHARTDVPDLLAHVDHLTAENARLREGVEALHRPVSTDALTGDHADESCDCEDECPTEPVRVCRECSRVAEESDPYYGERGLSATLWPCPTVALLNQTEGEDKP